MRLAHNPTHIAKISEHPWTFCVRTDIRESPLKLHVALPFTYFTPYHQKIDDYLNAQVEMGHIQGFKQLTHGGDVGQTCLKRVDIGFADDARARIYNNPFTIYLFEDSDPFVIADMVKNIDKLLEGVPGIVNYQHLSNADIQLPSSTHVSCRYEQLEGQYVPITSATTPSQLTQLKEAGTKHELYQSITKALTEHTEPNQKQQRILFFWNTHKLALDFSFDNEAIDPYERALFACELLDIPFSEFIAEKDQEKQKEVIHRACKKLEPQFHPDKNPEHEVTQKHKDKAEQIFKQINAAKSFFEENLSRLSSNAMPLNMQQRPRVAEHQYELAKGFQPGGQFYLDMFTDHLQGYQHYLVTGPLVPEQLKKGIYLYKHGNEVNALVVHDNNHHEHIDLPDTKTDIRSRIISFPKYNETVSFRLSDEDVALILSSCKSVVPSKPDYELLKGWNDVPKEEVGNALVLRQQRLIPGVRSNVISCPGPEAFWLLLKAGALPSKFLYGNDENPKKPTLRSLVFGYWPRNASLLKQEDQKTLLKNILTHHESLGQLNWENLLLFTDKAVTLGVISIPQKGGQLTTADVFKYYYDRYPEELAHSLHMHSDAINRESDFTGNAENLETIKAHIKQHPENLNKFGRHLSYLNQWLENAADEIPKMQELLKEREALYSEEEKKFLARERKEQQVQKNIRGRIQASPGDFKTLKQEAKIIQSACQREQCDYKEFFSEHEDFLSLRYVMESIVLGPSEGDKFFNHAALPTVGADEATPRFIAWDSPEKNIISRLADLYKMYEAFELGPKFYEALASITMHSAELTQLSSFDDKAVKKHLLKFAGNEIMVLSGDRRLARTYKWEKPDSLVERMFGVSAENFKLISHLKQFYVSPEEKAHLDEIVSQALRQMNDTEKRFWQTYEHRLDSNEEDPALIDIPHDPISKYLEMRCGLGLVEPGLEQLALCQSLFRLCKEDIFKNDDIPLNFSSIKYRQHLRCFISGEVSPEINNQIKELATCLNKKVSKLPSGSEKNNFLENLLKSPIFKPYCQLDSVGRIKSAQELTKGITRVSHGQPPLAGGGVRPQVTGARGSRLPYPSIEDMPKKTIQIPHQILKQAADEYQIRPKGRINKAYITFVNDSAENTKTVGELLQLVAKESWQLHKDSFICLVLKHADNNGELSTLFPDFPANINIAHLTETEGSDVNKFKQFFSVSPSTQARTALLDWIKNQFGSHPNLSNN